MLLVKGVKMLLKKMETILENDYAFSSVVVRFWKLSGVMLVNRMK